MNEMITNESIRCFINTTLSDRAYDAVATLYHSHATLPIWWDDIEKMKDLVLVHYAHLSLLDHTPFLVRYPDTQDSRLTLSYITLV